MKRKSNTTRFNVLFLIMTVYLNIANAADSSNSVNISSETITQSNNSITETVPISFLALNGNLPLNPTCPVPPATTTTPIGINTTAAMAYDSSLNGQSISAGYTCSISITHFQSDTAAEYLTHNNIPTTAQATQCASKLPNLPTNLSCMQGSITTANTSICYDDNTLVSYCNTYSCKKNGFNQQFAVYLSYNAVQSVYLSNGNKQIAIPKCSDGKALLILDSSVSSYNYQLTYTRNLYLQDNKGNMLNCQSKSAAYLAGNYPCSSTISITPNKQNTINIVPLGYAPLVYGACGTISSISPPICTVNAAPTLSTY